MSNVKAMGFEALVRSIWEANVQVSDADAFAQFLSLAKDNPELQAEAIRWGVRDGLRWIRQEPARLERNQRAAAYQRQRREENAEYARQHGLALADVFAHRNAAIQERAAKAWRDMTTELDEKYAKAAFADQIIAILDDWRLGDKVLGDCSRHDLLVGAAKSASDSAELALHAKFYGRLAQLVPDGQRLRDMEGRIEILKAYRDVFSPVEEVAA